jgi:hypothetical protein
MSKLATLATVLLVSLTTFVGAYLDSLRYDAALMPDAYIAPVVLFMDVGATGWVSRGDILMDTERRYYLKMEADYVQRGRPYLVQVMRTERGFCLDMTSAPLAMFKPSYYIRHDRVLVAESCDWLGYWSIGAAP